MGRSSLRESRRIKKAAHVVRRGIIKANSLTGRYRETIWLIGDGRSGTTWVSSLINHRQHYREMFEPFHPGFVPDFQFLRLNEYVRPDQDYPTLHALADDVFAGRFTHNRVDRSNNRLTYNGVLAKDIFATLFAKWAKTTFPWVKVVLLVRNPFPVARSKYDKRSWIWMTKPTDFLAQVRLVDDYLGDFSDQICRVEEGDDFVITQVLVWAVLHFVVFRQFSRSEIHVMFYEDIVRDVPGEMRRLLRFLGHDGQDVSIPQAIVDTPSRVSDPGTTFPRRDALADAWRSGLSTKQVDQGLSVLETFGLSEFYGHDGMPDGRALARFPIGSAGVVTA